MLLEYQFGMDHLSVLIVSKICDRSVKIKNNKNNIVQAYLIITLSLGSIETDRVISETVL